MALTSGIYIFRLRIFKACELLWQGMEDHGIVKES